MFTPRDLHGRVSLSLGEYVFAHDENQHRVHQDDCRGQCRFHQVVQLQGRGERDQAQDPSEYHVLWPDTAGLFKHVEILEGQGVSLILVIGDGEDLSLDFAFTCNSSIMSAPGFWLLIVLFVSAGTSINIATL